MNQTTTYKHRAVRSPYQPHPVQMMQEKAMDMQDAGNPVRQMLQKLCQARYNLCATFSPDTGIMATVKTPGLVAVRCELSMDGKPLGIGHGSTAISKLNKGLDRALYGCLNGALMSAVNSACKSLDVIRLHDIQERPSPVPSTDGSLPKNAEDVGNEQITQKQQGLLTELIYDRIQSEGERERWLSEMQTLSKSDAGELISNLLAAPRR